MARHVGPGSVTAADDHARARLEAVVHGRVQGVGFRIHVVRAAAALDLTGWVANASDGTVRCVAEGPRPALERLVEAIERGPTGAVVERVTVTWRPAAGDVGPFAIRSGAHPGD